MVTPSERRLEELRARVEFLSKVLAELRNGPLSRSGELLRAEEETALEEESLEEVRSPLRVLPEPSELQSPPAPLAAGASLVVMDSEGTPGKVIAVDVLTFEGATVEPTAPGKALVSIPAGAEILWAVAAEDSGDADEVDCHPCDDSDGTNEVGGTVITLLLPLSGGRGTNVRDDQVVAYVVTASGEKVCVSEYSDDPIGTVKMTTAWADGAPVIPDGWELFTAMGSRFPAGFTQGDNEYGAIGNSDGGVQGSNWGESKTRGPFLVSWEDVGLGGNMVSGGPGDYEHHVEQFDIRPPGYVIAFIRRVD